MEGWGLGLVDLLVPGGGLEFGEGMSEIGCCFSAGVGVFGGEGMHQMAFYRYVYSAQFLALFHSYAHCISW